MPMIAWNRPQIPTCHIWSMLQKSAAAASSTQEKSSPRPDRSSPRPRENVSELRRVRAEKDIFRFPPSTPNISVTGSKNGSRCTGVSGLKNAPRGRGVGSSTSGPSIRIKDLS